MDDYAACDATELAARVRQGAVHPLELVEIAIREIERVNPHLNAVVHRMYEEARTQARQAPGGPLRGVPMVIKDHDGFVRGQPWTASSRFLVGFVPDHDSEAMARLKRAGLLFLATTNCPELAILATTESTLRGPAHNPWDLSRSTGGSSGGSAALVAARAVPIGHGGDGGGSLRIPASDCGVVGLKATRGRVTLAPDWGEAWGGLIQWGALTRTVRDTALILDVMAGSHPGDPYACPPLERPLVEELGRDPGRLRVAIWPHSLYGRATNADLRDAVLRTADALTGLGHTVEEARPPIDASILARAYVTTVAAHVAVELKEFARWVGRRPTASQFEPSTWFLGQVGRALPATALIEARAAHDEAARVMGAFHQRFDVFVTASTAHPPPVLGELGLTRPDRIGLALLRAFPWAPALKTVLARLADVNLERTPNTQLFNQSGQPAISLPLHWTARALPAGVQFAAAAGGEGLLIRLAAQLEQELPWIQRRPPEVASG